MIVESTRQEELRRFSPKKFVLSEKCLKVNISQHLEIYNYKTELHRSAIAICISSLVHFYSLCAHNVFLKLFDSFYFIENFFIFNVNISP